MKPPHRHRQAQYSGFKHLYRWQFFHFSAGFKAARLWGYLSQGEKRGTMNTDPPQYFAWYWDLRWNNTRLTGLHLTPALNSNNCCVYLFIYFYKRKIFHRSCISVSKDCWEQARVNLCAKWSNNRDIRSELKWLWPVSTSLYLLHLTGDCLIISASPSQLSQHQREANQAEYFGGCWRKCLIRYFNILFSHSRMEFQDLDEMITKYEKFDNNNDLSTILSSGLTTTSLV